MAAITNEPTRTVKNAIGPKTKATVVLGAQWGDEGKGKLVDILSSQADAAIVCRCQGGNNAGHEVVVGDKDIVFHILPSGMMNPNCVNVIGNGVVIHIPQFYDELKALESQGITDWSKRLLISDRAHLVFDFHQDSDKLRESGKTRLGTTKRGIGPAYASKAQRLSLRVCDLIGDFGVFSERFKSLVSHFQRLFPALKVDVEDELNRYKVYAEQIRPLVCDTASYINTALQNENLSVIVEGANGLLLDIDHGTYPLATSSNCSIGGVCTGLGIPPHAIGNVYGATKAYLTRSGISEFPTELDNEQGSEMFVAGKEIGGTTGRPHRCGWLDLFMIKYSHMINGFTVLAISKLDVLDNLEEVKLGVAYRHKGELLTSYPATQKVLSEVEVEYLTLPGWKTSIQACRTFDDLPYNAQVFVKKIEEIVQIPVQWVGVGPSRDAMIQLF